MQNSGLRSDHGRTVAVRSTPNIAWLHQTWKAANWTGSSQRAKVTPRSVTGFGMNQNRLYLIIGVLAALVVVLGIYVWREESKPAGVELRIDDNGISVQEK